MTHVAPALNQISPITVPFQYIPPSSSIPRTATNRVSAELFRGQNLDGGPPRTPCVEIEAYVISSEKFNVMRLD
jgi:hypothetical protein